MIEKNSPDEPSLTEEGKLYAGYARVNITPRTGEFCSFRLAPNKRSLGVHDELFVHALYLASSDEPLLLISIDAMALSHALNRRIRPLLAEQTGLSDSQILLAATHTHNGAEVFNDEPLENNPQPGRLVDACIEAGKLAIEGRFPARIGWGHVNLPGLAKNRFEAKFGGDTAKVDERLDFLKIEDSQGNYKGVLWHFAAHPTTCMKAGYMSSADYYGVANRHVEGECGGFSVFFNGACGNINPELGERTFERADYYGGKIADGLLAAIPRTKTLDRGLLASSQRIMEIPLTLKRGDIVLADDRDEIIDYFKNIEAMAIEPNEQEYDKYGPVYQRLRVSWWKHRLVEEFGNVDSEPICLQAHRILDHFLLAVPGELFIELQFGLQKAFGNNRAIVFGYANGYSGYIPDSKSFEADSYETNPSYMHRVGQYAGEAIMETGIELIRRLSDG